MSKYAKLKSDAIAAYGPTCLMCGEHETARLTLHYQGPRAEIREQAGPGGVRTLRWMRRNGYPAGFSVLCFNCGWPDPNQAPE